MNRFAPTIYEHAAFLIKKTPSQVAYDEDLLVEGHLKAYEMYRQALITVGIDIYNVEAEALGLKVVRYSDNTLPSIETYLDDASNLKIPDLDAGRLLLNINAGKKLLRETGAAVNGALVGPYTLAAILIGYENFVLELMSESDSAKELLNFTCKFCLFYANEYIKRGMGVTVNESWIAPPLLSPEIYKEYIYPIHKYLFKELKERGACNPGLICGGNTTPIVKYLASTGSSLIMADANCDFDYFIDSCKKNNIILRASINSGTLAKGTIEQIESEAIKLINKCHQYDKVIFGCGIVPYDTSPDKVLILKEIFMREMGNVCAVYDSNTD